MRHFRNNPRLLIWFAPFKSLSISAAYLVPFFLEKGLDQSDIFVLQSIFSLAVVLWEVPSGWVADRIGRARSIQISAPIAAVAMTAYGLSGQYWQFVICELLLAIAYGLISGADEALLIDSLKSDGREHDYVRYHQRVQSFGYAVVTIGVPISFLLVSTLGVSSTLIADGILTALGSFIAFRLVEPPVHEAEELGGYTALQSTRRLFANKESRWLVVFGVLLSTSTYIGYWLAAPYYTSIGIPLVAFSAILAVRSLLKAWLSHKFHQENHAKQMMALHVVLAGVPYVLMATGQLWLAFAVLGHDVVQSLHSAPLSRRLNEQIPSRFRAMLNSVASLQRRLSYAVIGPLAGFLVDRVGLSSGLAILGAVFSGVAAIAFLRLLKLGSFDKGR